MQLGSLQVAGLACRRSVATRRHCFGQALDPVRLDGCPVEQALWRLLAQDRFLTVTWNASSRSCGPVEAMTEPKHVLAPGCFLQCAAILKERVRPYQEKIRFAEHMLVTNAVAKMRPDEVLLTYGFSSTIYSVLIHAHKRSCTGTICDTLDKLVPPIAVVGRKLGVASQYIRLDGDSRQRHGQQMGRRIRVIIVDSRPQNEGRQLLQKLLRHGIPCTYTHLSALSYVMDEATKVFLGASAVHTNGTVLSRAGTAAVAMMAATFGRPVLICCETYKFHERVQLDSFTYNELGNPDALVQVPVRPAISALSNWQQQPCLGLLNLEYDVMPADFITLIITEFGAIPSTSVPVILREYRQQPTLNSQSSS